MKKDDIDENKIEILFSSKPVNVMNNQLVIYPIDDNWNDFGHQIRCRFRIGKIDNGYDIYEGDMLFSFLNKSDDKEFIDEYKSLSSFFNRNKIEVYKENIPDFFTMLPDMQSYRKLVSFYDIKLANEILFQINDLVSRKQKNEYADWLDVVIETKAFKLGFMRNSEPFFTYHNAESVLNGLSEERFDNISNSLTLSFKLNTFKNNHNLNLKYSHDSLIPKRINVLIGKNGLGKSQTLNMFCRSALRYKKEEHMLYDSKTNDRPMINRLLAIGTPGETSNTFPAERISSQKLYYRRLNLTRNGRAQASRSTVELLIQLARSEEYIGEDDRWTIFLQALEKAFGVDNIVLQLKNGSYCELKKLQRSNSEQSRLELWSDLDYKKEPLFSDSQDYYPLSSGQLTFFKFALLSSLFIENGSFVLMDEPETHLHPNLISDFVDLLDFLLEKTGSYALLATHSVFLVREVSREQVHVFKVDDENNIDIVPPRLRTFGANIDRISEFVFGDDIENRLTDKIINRVDQRSFKNIDEEIGDEISLPSLMSIKRHIERA